MKRGKKLIGLGIAVILGLSLILIPVLNRTSPAEAAVTWAKSSEVTLDNELYVVDAWVIRESSTSYKMWYTHGKKDLSILDIVNDITAILTDNIITDIANLDLEALLNDLEGLNVGNLKALLDGTSTVIGYATSTNGRTWTVVNSEVLAGSGGAWNSIGAPSVIWDATDSKYKMWYTRLKTDVDQTALEGILGGSGMGGTTAQRKAAIQNLLDGTHTVIEYTESSDGVVWEVPQEVLTGNGQAINSVGAASVIKDDSTYKMWYTQGESDFADSDIDDILADITDFDLVFDDVLAILDSSSTVIRYATSPDGINWSGSNPIVLTGSGAAWDSVADPSVIKSGSTYEMWYTEGETQLIKGDFRSVLDEIAGLANSSWNILKAFVAGDFEALLNELKALDISTITALLDGTRTVIGYATSSDGIIWTPQIAPDLVGSSSPWGSVAAPTVVKTGSGYQMWFTEGIAGLTVENLLALVLGTDLPIGYAYYTPPAPPPAPPPPPPTIETELFGIEGSFPISDDGVMQETIEATSDAGDFTITIPEDTIALDEDGDPLSTFTVELDLDPPDPPAEAHIIGIPYKLGPPGATFSPPITIEFIVDPLPPGVAVEDLVIAYYDEEAGEWVELPTTYDPATNTFMADVSHFTTFAIIAIPAELPPAELPPMVVPAVFTVTSLGIAPSEVAPGEEVNINVLVANTGGESGSYTVVLKIDGVKEAEETVTIAAGSSQTVTFSVTREEADSYTVTVDGLNSSFTVVAPLLAPATFTVTSLGIAPSEVAPGEEVNISVLVANTGDESGSYTVVLKIDGVKEAEETVTIAAGESLNVSFSVTKDVAGTYSVDVSGFTSSFTVKEKVVSPVVSKPLAWWVWLVIGLVSAAAVGFAVWMVVRRRRD